MRHHKLLNICNNLLLLLYLLLFWLMLLIIVVVEEIVIVIVVASFLACEMMMTDYLGRVVKHTRVFLVHQRLDELISSITHTIEITRLLLK